MTEPTTIRDALEAAVPDEEIADSLSVESASEPVIDSAPEPIVSEPVAEALKSDGRDEKGRFKTKDAKPPVAPETTAEVPPSPRRASSLVQRLSQRQRRRSERLRPGAPTCASTGVGCRPRYAPKWRGASVRCRQRCRTLPRRVGSQSSYKTSFGLMKCSSRPRTATHCRQSIT